MKPQLKAILTSIVLAAVAGSADAAVRHSGHGVAAKEAYETALVKAGVTQDAVGGTQTLRVAAAETGTDIGVGGTRRAGRNLSDAEVMVASDAASGGGFSMPEPGDWSVVVAGMVGLAAIARRRMS